MAFAIALTQHSGSNTFSRDIIAVRFEIFLFGILFIFMIFVCYTNYHLLHAHSHILIRVTFAFRSQPFIFLVNSNDSNFDRIKNYEYISVNNFRQIYLILWVRTLIWFHSDECCRDAVDEHVIWTNE